MLNASSSVSLNSKVPTIKFIPLYDKGYLDSTRFLESPLLKHSILPSSSLRESSLAYD